MTVPPIAPLLRRRAERDDPLFATAPPATRLLLVEVPGPWGRTAISDSRLDRYAGGRLAELAVAAGARVLLVRRPGRHVLPPAGVPKAWALADLRPGREHVRWGTWRVEHDLLDLDLDAEPIREPAGPQRQRGPGLHARPARRVLRRARAPGRGRARRARYRLGRLGVLARRGRPLRRQRAARAAGRAPRLPRRGQRRDRARGLRRGPARPRPPPRAVRPAAGRAGRRASPAGRPRGRPAWTPCGRCASRATAPSGGSSSATPIGAGWSRSRARWSPPARLTCSSAGPDRVRRLDLVSIEDAVAESSRAHAEP